ncbi:hypothetical protein PG984_013218 [Apiospora sp. TS-2023a]
MITKHFNRMLNWKSIPEHPLRDDTYKLSSLVATTSKLQVHSARIENAALAMMRATTPDDVRDHMDSLKGTFEDAQLHTIYSVPEGSDATSAILRRLSSESPAVVMGMILQTLHDSERLGSATLMKPAAPGCFDYRR